MSLCRNHLESWLGKIDIKADRVLDLGGAANPVVRRLRSFEAGEYVCFDLGVEEPKIEYIKFDINLPLEQLKGYDDKSLKFDCLFCLEVFEYVWDPVEAMNNIYRLLCEDGTAYISFLSIYPVHNPVQADSLRYTRQVIEKYLSLYNFKVLEIVPRIATDGAESLGRFYAEEGMHALKGSGLPYDIGYLVKATKTYFPAP